MRHTPYQFPSDAALRRWDIHRRRTCARCLSENPGFRSNRIAWRIPLVASGQAENKMSDDVALHLGGACFDGVSAGAQVGVGPLPFVDGVRITCRELTVGTEDFLSDLLQALVKLAPKNFLDRSLGARDASGRNAAEGAHLVEAHNLDFRATLRELLANDGIFGGGAAVALDGARELDEAREITLEDEMQARAVRAALVHQRAHRHVPPVVYFSKDIFNGHANIPEEQLVELGFPGHLAQRSNFDAGRFHIHEEDGKSLVFRCTDVGANDEFAPVTHPTVASPDFLAIHNVMIVLEARFGLQTSEIRTGVRLGEALAPDLFCAQNFWDVALFLRFGTVGNDGWADEAQTKRIGHGRRFDASHLFPEKGLLHQCGAAASVFLGPGNCGPAAFLESFLPGAQVREGLFHGFFTPLVPVLRNVGSKPRAEFVAKRRLLGG